MKDDVCMVIVVVSSIRVDDYLKKIMTRVCICARMDKKHNKFSL